jgi:hypothetical protein
MLLLLAFMGLFFTFTLAIGPKSPNSETSAVQPPPVALRSGVQCSVLWVISMFEAPLEMSVVVKALAVRAGILSLVTSTTIRRALAP